MNLSLLYRICKLGCWASLAIITACTSSSSREEVLYQSYCASCHVAPEIDDLPKDIWEATILPEMGARMGIRDSAYNLFEGSSFKEIAAINKTRIYPYRPIIRERDWELLQAYILSLAPDSLKSLAIEPTAKELTQFAASPISLDQQAGSFITYLEYDSSINKLMIGDLGGRLIEYDFEQREARARQESGSGVLGHARKGDTTYTTIVGYLDPSELSSGRVYRTIGDLSIILPQVLHRPVHMLVHDLDNNGIDELVISEFGNYTGRLSLISQGLDQSFKREVLLELPGTIRVLAKDMNKDGKDDLVALTSQGDEGIFIFYNQGDLTFNAEQILRFSPVYGSSWFELIDYDGDGDEDIITVHGDNADKSYVHKPYHGMRIHLNNGENQFEEKHFYPMYGATRVVARDFDQDGDIDMGLISTFPDYAHAAAYAFVYLENLDEAAFNFQPYTFKEVSLGRWFLMDAADVDKDGDEDIVLSSFTYSITPVPAELTDLWKKENVDLMLLENKLLPSGGSN